MLGVQPQGAINHYQTVSLKGHHYSASSSYSYAYSYHHDIPSGETRTSPVTPLLPCTMHRPRTGANYVSCKTAGRHFASLYETPGDYLFGLERTDVSSACAASNSQASSACTNSSYTQESSRSRDSYCCVELRPFPDTCRYRASDCRHAGKSRRQAMQVSWS